MKRKALGNALMLLLLISMLAVAPSVGVTEANPLPPDWMNPRMTITIHSPQNGTNNALPVLVNFTAQCTGQFVLGHSDPDNPPQDWIRDFYYVIDSQNMSSQGINFTQVQASNVSDPVYFRYYSGQASLANLTDGSHTITVYWGVLVNVGTPAQFIVYNSSWSSTIQFNVDTHMTPSPSPQETEPFPTALLIAGAVAVAIVCLGLLVYFKKRRRDKGE